MWNEEKRIATASDLLQEAQHTLEFLAELRQTNQQIPQGLADILKMTAEKIHGAWEILN